MQNIFLDTRTLDELCRQQYGLSEDVMMENAALALQNETERLTGKSSGIILILAGGGNNGADGYALSRRLCGTNWRPVVCQVKEPKSSMCLVQHERASKCGVTFIPGTQASLKNFLEQNIQIAAVVDCIFGSGFHGEFDEATACLVNMANEIDAPKISCDVPSGIDINGQHKGTCFVADTTVTMGALKLCLFSDGAKDFCGKIVLADLGVGRAAFEMQGKNLCPPQAFLLEAGDAKIPYRTRQNVHKGTFGHCAVALGQKPGAAVIAASAALKFGAGLVTLVGTEENPGKNTCIPWELMSGTTVPQNTTALAMGMGLGRTESAALPFFKWLSEHKDAGAVFDADIFYIKPFVQVLKERSAMSQKTILTPHPKEFLELLKMCSIPVQDVQDAVTRRIELSREFCRRFPDTVLLVKGANSVISQNDETYINTLGSSALAKAGSGDVLSGLAASLLAQGYGALDAAITASLEHALASQQVKPDFSLTPFTLISQISS